MVKFLLTHTVRQSNTTPQEITMSLEAIRGNYSLGKFNNNAEYPIEEVVNILEHRWTELALQKEKVELYGQAFRALISGDLGQDSWVEGDALTVYLRSVAKLTDEIVTVLPANLLFVIEHYGKNEITEKVIRICRFFKYIPKNQILILPLFMQNHWAIYTQIQDVGTLFCSLNHERNTRKAFLPVWNLLRYFNLQPREINFEKPNELQRDGVSCGVYIAAYATRMLQKEANPSNIPAQTLQKYRHYMIHCILTDTKNLPTLNYYGSSEPPQFYFTKQNEAILADSSVGQVLRRLDEENMPRAWSLLTAALTAEPEIARNWIDRAKPFVANRFYFQRRGNFNKIVRLTGIEVEKRKKKRGGKKEQRRKKRKEEENKKETKK